MENKMDKETENKLMQFQMLDQNLQNIILQKQTFQAQLIEIENALKEMEKTKEKPYKIIGTIMVASTKEDITKDLKEKQSMLNLRIKNLEKQENQFKEQAESLQKDVLKQMKK